MTGLPIAIRPLGESALLIEIGREPTISRERSSAITRLANQLLEQNLTGVIDIVPGYSTILIAFDLVLADPDALERAILTAAGTIDESIATPKRRITIPTCYGGDLGMDLAEFCEKKGLTPEEMIALHTGEDYLVACMGFSPGYGYLLGLPPRLAMPRRATPRVRVPVGSVSIGGNQSGIYTHPTPGGFWLIGTTPARLFDLRLADPILLQPGDALRFAVIDRELFRELDAASAAGEQVAGIELLGCS